jgi:hypothetical protein
MRLAGRLVVHGTKDALTDEISPQWQCKAYQDENGKLRDAVTENVWVNEWLPSSDVMG